MFSKILKYSSYIKFLTIIICISVIYFNIKNENIILDTIQNLKVEYIFIPLVLGIVLMILWSNLVYRTLVGSVNLKIKYKTWAKIFFNSQFYNLIPFAGFVYKGIQLIYLILYLL